MDQYDQAKGKAYSFFSIIAKNYLILNNTNEYKHRKIQQRIDIIENEYVFDIVDEDQEQKFNDDVPDFVNLMIEYWENNLSYIFTKQNEIKIAHAIISLFNRVHSIESYNKKFLYILIREMTGLRTQYITSVINKMKEHLVVLQKNYNDEGYFDTNDTIDDFI